MGIHSSQKGQILVLLALAMVVILGFTALAIDGSMAYSDRRNSQTTVDSAALAGAGAAAEVLKNYSPSAFYCGSTLAGQASDAAVVAAQASSLEDAIVLSNIEGDPNHVDVICQTGPFSSFLDIHVQVTSETESFFAQVFRSENMISTKDAISRVHPKQNLAFGNAIASLAHDCVDGGIYMEGSSSIQISQGGIFSNSCIEGKGNISLLVENASIRYKDTFIDAGSAVFSPAPELADVFLPENQINPPDCSGLPTYGPITNGGTLSSGVYSGIAVNEGEVLTLSPGLYCLDNDFSANGHALINGDNVTIYMRNGSIKLEGTATINLTAPSCEDILCGVPPAIRGILFFVDPTNEGIVKFSGTPDSFFMGTIYAPASLIEISGTGDYATLQTQLIGSRVSVVGNVDFLLNLDGAEIYQQPSSIELLK